MRLASSAGPTSAGVGAIWRVKPDSPDGEARYLRRHLEYHSLVLVDQKTLYIVPEAVTTT